MSVPNWFSEVIAISEEKLEEVLDHRPAPWNIGIPDGSSPPISPTITDFQHRDAPSRCWDASNFHGNPLRTAEISIFGWIWCLNATWGLNDLIPHIQLISTVLAAGLSTPPESPAMLLSRSPASP